MTKKEFLQDVIANYAGITEDGKAIAEKMIAQLDKKYAGNGKPSKKQIENEGIKTQIAEFLEVEGSISATALAAALGLSVPKVAALAKQMGIRKDKIKGKVFYMSDDFTQDTEENEDNEQLSPTPRQRESAKKIALSLIFLQKTLDFQ